MSFLAILSPFFIICFSVRMMLFTQDLPILITWFFKWYTKLKQTGKVNKLFTYYIVVDLTLSSNILP